MIIIKTLKTLQEKGILTLVPLTIAFVILVVSFIAVPKVGATNTNRDKHVSYSEWSECRANAECGVELGTKTKTKTITCEVKLGHDDECTIDEQNCTEWGWFFGKYCKKSVTTEIVYDTCKVETPVCEEPEEPIVCEEGYHLDGEECYPDTNNTPPSSPTPSAPVCNQTTPVLLPLNVHVVRNGSDATVKAHILEGNSANIYYRENDADGWKHSLANVPVTNQWLEVTIHDLKPELGYTFAVQSAHSCAGGELIVPIVIDPPAWGVVFPVTSWELW